MQYGCSKKKRIWSYKPCTGAVLEIDSTGYVRYIEMDGLWAHNLYSGPITNWDGPDGTWTGCCVGCCCCRKGCVHFDAVIPAPVTNRDTPISIHVNGRNFHKQANKEEKKQQEEQETPLSLGSGFGSPVNIFAS